MGGDEGSHDRVNNKAVQVGLIGIITALALAFSPAADTLPIPFARHIMGAFFGVLLATLSYVWIQKAEQAGQGKVEEIRSENSRLMRESASLKSSNEEFKEKIVKSSTMVTSLGAIAKLTTKTLDLDKLLGGIMEAVGSMGATQASIWLVEEGSDKLTLASSVGWKESDKETSVTLGSGIVGYVAASGNAVDPGSVQRDPTLMDQKKASDFPTVLCVPLVNAEERLGALNIEAFDKKGAGGGAFKDEMRLISFMASLAAMSIKNARVFGATKEFAEKDGLTGMYNHRYYQDTMDRELKRADRYGDPLSILLTDIDKFKSFNDTYGHQVGDEVLAQTAHVMQAIARDSDIACRYGGEEFVLILPQTGKRGAAQVAERLRKRVEESIYDTAKGKLSVTLSVGVATFPEDARDKNLMVKLCDEALYRAKENGRNRVELAMAEGAEPEAPAAPAAPPPPAAQAVGLSAEEHARLEQAQAAAIAKARALAQAGHTEQAKEAAALARRIATRRTQLMAAAGQDPNLAAKARAAAKIAAQRQGAASADPAARAAQVRQTAAQPSVPPGSDKA